MKTVYDLYPDIDNQHQRNPAGYPELKAETFFWEVYNKAKPYSMLPVEGFYNLYLTMQYIATRPIPGDFVECGVFLGGAMLAASEFASHFGLTDRKFFLCDTYEGFPAGTSDTDLHGTEVQYGTHANFQDVVRNTLSLSRHPQDKFELIAGPVEQTLPGRTFPKFAMVRLDTDYYDSTMVELVNLYPALNPGGVLIVDDYGHFQGVRKATDEYLAEPGRAMLFHRVSYTIRSGVKL